MNAIADPSPRLGTHAAPVGFVAHRACVALSASVAPVAFVARLACVALACLLVATPAAAVETGQLAPAFSIPDVNGKALQLSSLRGKLVYVDFWASWCAPCRRSFPWMNAMQDKYGDKGLAIVGINVDQRKADAEKFLAQVPAKFRVVYDAQGTAPKEYAVKGMPSSVLIDPEGRVLAVHAGFRDEDRDALESAIRSALPQRVN